MNESCTPADITLSGGNLSFPGPFPVATDGSFTIDTVLNGTISGNPLVATVSITGKVSGGTASGTYHENDSFTFERHAVQLHHAATRPGRPRRPRLDGRREGRAPGSPPLTVRWVRLPAPRDACPPHRRSGRHERCSCRHVRLPPHPKMLALLAAAAPIVAAILVAMSTAAHGG